LESADSLELPGQSGGRVSIFYNTAWENACLHGSVNGGEWMDYHFQRLSAAGGNLKVVHVNTNGNKASNGAPLLEFVVHNEAGQYDKAPEDENYRAQHAGGYRLEGGKMFPIRDEAFMLVSDLDDTMFGDDEASLDFKDFWERDARLRGSCLVYNTGRALDKWLSLWREKSWCLAAPDHLITAVGTKVFEAAPDSFQGWELDQEFAAKLDEGWNLEKVRDAAYKALKAAGKERMHFRPPDEQNEHKVTCGVRVDVIEKIKEIIARTLEKEKVSAQLIVSGRGDWRFLDIVSKRAGKLAALQYVRKKQGFTHSQTIACGDSGNDKDMLSGQNRAICVGNAEEELKQWLQSEKREQAGVGKLYVARSDRARGILEGLKHFGF